MPTFDMRGGNGPTRVMAIDRMSSLRIASLIASTAGLKRSTWPTMSVTLARRAAAMMSLPCSTEEAIGFSTRIWTPRSMQASAIGVMQMSRRRDGERVDPEVEQLLDIGHRATAQGARHEFRLLAIGIGNADELDTGKTGKHAGMIAAHDADADHADTQRTLSVRICRPHHFPKMSPSPVRWRAIAPGSAPFHLAWSQAAGDSPPRRGVNTF